MNEEQLRKAQDMEKELRGQVRALRRDLADLKAVGREILRADDTPHGVRDWFDVTEKLAALVHDDKYSPKYVPAKDGDGVELDRYPDDMSAHGMLRIDLAKVRNAAREALKYLDNHPLTERQTNALVSLRAILKEQSRDVHIYCPANGMECDQAECVGARCVKLDPRPTGERTVVMRPVDHSKDPLPPYTNEEEAEMERRAKANMEIAVASGIISSPEWRWIFINGRRHTIAGTRVTIREIIKIAGADITKNYVQYAAGEGLVDCRTDDQFLLVDDTANFQVKARA